MANTHWTKEEDARLLKLKDEGSSLSEMAMTLGRSIGAINTRLVVTHGFRVRKAYKKKTIHSSREGRRAWTEAENSTLKEWYSVGFSFADIARELNRNEGSVRSQYNLLRKSNKGLPAEVRQDTSLLRVIATQEQHTKLLKGLFEDLEGLEKLVKYPTLSNSILLKLNQLEKQIISHGHLNSLDIDEELVLMLPEDKEFSTVVKSDRVIIRRVE